MEKVKINNKVIGEGEPCFIIAEAGVNHNGDVKQAMKLIDVAKDAGADAVKFQTFKSEDVVTKNAKMAKYQKKNIGKVESQLEMLKRFELSNSEFEELNDHCKKKEIMFLSTPHSVDAIDFLDPIIPAYKVSSSDLTNFPFLKKIALKNKPIILSTGMANLNEIKEAIAVIEKCGFNKIILLHCVTNYPANITDINLNAIKTLMQTFTYPVGFSDHTLSTIIPIAAFSMGACVIEKHFTLDKDLPGPDHKASLSPSELKEMVNSIRIIETALGDGIKKPITEEEQIKKIARKSIVSKIDIPKGTIITERMLDVKRPGTGIESKHWDEIVGKKTKYEIKKDEVLTWDMVE